MIRFAIVVLLFAAEAYADRKECFGRYRAGEINKEQMMKCSNVEDNGYLDAPVGDHAPKKQPEPEQKTAVGQVRDESSRTWVEMQSMCAGKWAGDYRMEKHCLEKQVSALKELNAIVNSRGVDGNVYFKCKSKWYPDMRMIRYCYNKQMSAKAWLGK